MGASTALAEQTMSSQMIGLQHEKRKAFYQFIFEAIEASLSAYLETIDQG